MKENIKLLVKGIVIICFLFVSPLMPSIELFSRNKMPQFMIYSAKTEFDFELSEAFNMLEVVYKEDIPLREVDIQPTEIPELPDDTINDQYKVYIYSTHQGETYTDGKSVIDASYYLKQLLEKHSIEVTIEQQNFMQELRNQGLTYNESYLISRNAVIDAIVEEGGYDLIIDLHRDSLPRHLSYIEINGMIYAKLMIVIGGLSSHRESIINNSQILFDISNNLVHGIMKPALVREAYYNQDITENMLLIEVGSDQNSFEEVKNSLDILSQAIIKMREQNETIYR